MRAEVSQYPHCKEGKVMREHIIKQNTESGESKPKDLYDIDAEKALIGSILVYPELLNRVVDLSTFDFQESRHGQIWRAMLALGQVGEPIDNITVANQ